jgi:hypothetical protein
VDAGWIARAEPEFARHVGHGILAGLTAGLPLREAHQLGVLTAPVAVQSLYTINFELDRAALWACVEATGMSLVNAVRALLQIYGACSKREQRDQTD